MNKYITPMLRKHILSSDVLSSMPNNGHSLISPSSARRWSDCTGSVKNIATFRKYSSDSKASIEGTLGHFLLAASMLLQTHPKDLKNVSYLSDLKNDAIANLGASVKNYNNSEEVRTYSQHCLNTFLNCTFDNDMRFHIGQCYERLQVFVDDGYRVSVETYVDNSWLMGHSHSCGSADVVMTKGSHRIVPDLKYGAGIEVDPVDNYQGILYACDKSLISNNIKDVTIVIMQPRINNGVWKEWKTTTEHIIDVVKKEIRPASIKALGVITGDVHPHYEPSVETCRFCPNKLTCRARLNRAKTDIKNVLKIANVPKHGVLPESDADGLSNDELSKLLLMMPAITAYFDTVKSVATKRAMHSSVKGYKVVTGRGSRAYKIQDKKELKSFFKSIGISPFVYSNITIKSVAKLSKADLTKQQQAALKHITVWKDGKPALVESNNSKPEFRKAIFKDIKPSY